MKKSAISPHVPHPRTGHSDPAAIHPGQLSVPGLVVPVVEARSPSSKVGIANPIVQPTTEQITEVADNYYYFLEQFDIFYAALENART